MNIINPFSSSYHSIQDISNLSGAAQTGIVFLTGVVAVLTFPLLCLPAVVTFRLLVNVCQPKETNSTVQKVQGQKNHIFNYSFTEKKESDSQTVEKETKNPLFSTDFFFDKFLKDKSVHLEIIPEVKKGKSLFLKIRQIDSTSKEWNDYNLNFQKNSPISFNSPNKIYVLEYYTSRDCRLENLTLVGLISNQKAAYLGNLITVDRKLTANDALKVWHSLLQDLSIKVITLQDTAHLSIGADKSKELTTRWYFPIIRDDGFNFYERLGYSFKGQTIDVNDKPIYISPERYRQAYINLGQISLLNQLEENMQKLQELQQQLRLNKNQNNIKQKIDDLENYLAVLALHVVLDVKDNNMKNVLINLSNEGKNKRKNYPKLLKNIRNNPSYLEVKKSLHSNVVKKLDNLIKAYEKNYRDANQDLECVLFNFIGLNTSLDAAIVHKCNVFHKFLENKKLKEIN